MKILSLTDRESAMVYSPQIVERFAEVSMLISCGDLPHHYLDYAVSMLNLPFYYVHGNHVVRDMDGIQEPHGGTNLHCRAVQDEQSGLLLAGMEGSVRYNMGEKQYTQGQMWRRVWMLALKLQRNRLRHGRFLDVFVAHSPPWRIQDADDLPHHGFKAFVWLIRVFKPQLFLHGHIHLYRQDAPYQTQVGETLVINTYPFRVVEVSI